MTIQRQYILPNCSLMLEGLSADASNVLSILANAEFKIIGLDQPLAGGSEFFKAVVAAVSAYSQRLLSGFDHPEHVASQAPVAVEPSVGQYHRLTIQPELLNEAANRSESQAVNLSTVQLFDMVEAIDQFCADAQTLPDFSVDLAPLPRKYVRSEEPLAQRALPPLLGISTLAVAALGLFFLPVPELVESEVFEDQNPAALEALPDNESAGDSPEDDLEIVPETETVETADNTIEPAEQPEVAVAVLDETQLAELQQQVQQQVSEALSADTVFAQPLSYQISVAENGDIVGYDALDDASQETLDDTPLPALTYIPIDATSVQPVAQFELTFDTDGTVNVLSEDALENSEPPENSTTVPEEVIPEPKDSSSSVTPDTTKTAAVVTPEDDTSAAQLSALIATPIRDAERIYELNQNLRRTIVQKLTSDWSGPEVRYRIRLDEAGNVIGYEADNSDGDRYANDLEIPSLVKTSDDERPQLDFLVVINDENVVEVNPWDGWP